MTIYSKCLKSERLISGFFGENITNPIGKDLTLAISSLAKEISVAADMKNGETLRIKLGEFKSKCGELHAKIRDKK